LAFADPGAKIGELAADATIVGSAKFGPIEILLRPFVRGSGGLDAGFRRFQVWDPQDEIGGLLSRRGEAFPIALGLEGAHLLVGELQLRIGDGRFGLGDG
jgi:hypothetical protein